MFPERYFGLTILPEEIYPAPIESILNRFGKEYDREEQSVAIESVARSSLGSVFLKHLGEDFELEVNPSECPYYKLILAGLLLTGMTNPSDVERLSQILCGHLVKNEDTMGEFGPLSGRSGKDYQPLSRCWKTTIELARLVEFMKQVEDIPTVDNSIGNEAELREVLNKRERVRNNNEGRQMVFTMWNEIRLMISAWFNKKTETKELPQTQEETKLDKNTLMVIRPKVFDTSAQLNVGGTEYRELTNWVEKTILVPLIALVGEENLSIYLGANRIFLSAQHTAENCPEKPQAKFIGGIS